MKTCELPARTGIPLVRIRHLLSTQRIPKPGRDASGDFVWTEADIQALLTHEARRKPHAQPACAAGVV